jgi:hypothetical protein
MSGLDEALKGAKAALNGLKDFQRDTVEYVYEQLFAPNSTRRFLVADEVGLGKTLVARGVIAKAIEHLRGKVERIDVIYVCSNADIARQNINRLKVEGEQVALASRLTLLPKFARDLRESKTGVNFVSFTPATSFDVQGGLGNRDERVLLYVMLRELWDLGSSAAPLNVLQGQVDSERFREHARALHLREFDPDGASTRQFGAVLEHHIAQARAAGVPDLRARFEALCAAYPTARSRPDGETARQRSRFVGDLRAALAASCVKTLEPDLVILDEFQRFSHLLDGEDDASRLARELFDFPDVRVLLLSATPYKMYTEAGEAQGEDHYSDFLRTLRFLERTAGDDRSLDALLSAYRSAWIELDTPGAEQRLHECARSLESRLRRVIARTERLASTPDRSGMLVDVPAKDVSLMSEDALGYVALQNVARQFEHHDTVEYWKSAPYPLSFMDGEYKLKRELLEAMEDGEVPDPCARAIAAAGNHRLDWASIQKYGAVDGGNGRMRALVEHTVGRGAHRLLWIVPSLPYYGLRGAFADPDVAPFTKRLVFSSWRFAPRAIAALLSYEAERRMLGERAIDYSREARGPRTGLLRFGRAEGRLTGMPVLALMFPSAFLARACDPARLAAEGMVANAGRIGPVPVDDVLEAARMQIELALRRVPDQESGGQVDERWYWAAPLLLDHQLEPEATKAWFSQKNLAALWSGEKDGVDEEVQEESELWKEHVDAACAFANGGGEPLGRRPADLVDVLAELALAGPGVTLLRSMLRVVGLRTDSLAAESGVEVRNGAARAAWAFRAMFNQPEVMELVERENRESDVPYWRLALRYGVDGCLQAVLDEYVHVLRDFLGVVTGSAGERVHEIADHIAEVLSLRTATLTMDDLGMSPAGELRREPRRMRSHFALRFGDERAGAGEIPTRADSVRKAFNSPFRPFVLATTSVGQEGLDFHTYCHAVVHWNLPTNPVDFEQREGRVHRYKGHAVRRNVASEHGFATIADQAIDPSEMMFEKARGACPPQSSDIMPYWVYPVPGGARIERHVLALPLSRECEMIHRLSRSLVMYRMVFGQPRQEDLLRFLMKNVDAPRLQALLEATSINLTPRTEPTAAQVA